MSALISSASSSTVLGYPLGRTDCRLPRHGLGLLIGLMAGFLGTLTDEILMRFTDMILVIPYLPLLIVLVAVLGASITISSSSSAYSAGWASPGLSAHRF